MSSTSHASAGVAAAVSPAMRIPFSSFMIMPPRTCRHPKGPGQGREGGRRGRPLLSGRERARRDVVSDPLAELLDERLQVAQRERPARADAVDHPVVGPAAECVVPCDAVAFLL